MRRAIAAFKKWVSREPKNSNAHAFLGIALIAAGNPKEAIPMLDKALNLNPDRPGWYVRPFIHCPCRHGTD